MKILIWISVMLAECVAIVVLKDYGIRLGAIPMVIFIGCFMKLADFLCKKWDQRSANNSNHSSAYTNEESPFCPICGCWIAKETNFCPKCGYDIRKKTHRSSKPRKTSIDTYTLFMKFAPLAFICLMGVAIYVGTTRPISPVKIPPTETQVLLQPKSRPTSGIMVSANMSGGVAPFEVTAPTNSDCFCVLQSRLNSSNMVKFYVRAGNTYELLVPVGTYNLYFATGNDWYGLDNLFGEDTVYQKCDDIFDFVEERDGYSGWTVELQSTSYGNLDSDRISKEEFPS